MGLHRMALESIQAGSIRGFYRLNRAKLTNTQLCPLCGSAEKENQEHIFHNCLAIAEIRLPYQQAVKTIGEECYTKESLEEIVHRNSAFRNCGVMLEGPQLIATSDKKPHTNTYTERWPELESLSSDQRIDELW